jgi:hypothetical protein
MTPGPLVLVHQHDRSLMDPVSLAQGDNRIDSPHLDAINLMLRDLRTRHDDIRHRAAFRGCTTELLTLQQELMDYLLQKKDTLLGVKSARPQELAKPTIGSGP